MKEAASKTTKFVPKTQSVLLQVLVERLFVLHGGWVRILSRFLRMPRLYGSEILPSLQVSANRRCPKDSPFPSRAAHIIVLEGNEKTIVETKAGPMASCPAFRNTTVKFLLAKSSSVRIS